MLDDGTEADTRLELMKRHCAVDELVAFFYDSFTEMTGHVGEFFGLHQVIYDSYGVRIDQASTMPQSALRFCLSFLIVVAGTAPILLKEVKPHSRVGEGYSVCTLWPL